MRLPTAAWSRTYMILPGVLLAVLGFLMIAADDVAWGLVMLVVALLLLISGTYHLMCMWRKRVRGSKAPRW